MAESRTQNRSLTCRFNPPKQIDLPRYSSNRCTSSVHKTSYLYTIGLFRSRHSVTCVELPGTEWEASTRGRAHVCTWMSRDPREIGGEASTIDRGRGVTGSAPANILAIYKASSALWLCTVSSGSLLFPCQPADSPARPVCASDIPPAVSHVRSKTRDLRLCRRTESARSSPLILSPNVLPPGSCLAADDLGRYCLTGCFRSQEPWELE